MAEEYSREQLWELYKKLPQELKDALFAEETGNNIYEICERYGLGKSLETIVDYVGNVLLGLLPPEDFQNTLETELKLEKETAEKVAREINRFIFYPVKPELEQLYKTGGVSAEEEISRPTERKTEEKPAGEDRYREPLE